MTSTDPTLVFRTDIAEARRLSPATQQLTAMLSIKAPQMTETEGRRAALRICAAIDVSGSMEGQRLSLAMDTLKFIIGELRSTDELGIIAYDTNVYERLPPVKMDDGGKDLALAVAMSLVSGSSTNLSGGLLAGVDQVLGRHEEGFNAALYNGHVQQSSPFGNMAMRNQSPPPYQVHLQQQMQMQVPQQQMQMPMQQQVQMPMQQQVQMPMQQQVQMPMQQQVQMPMQQQVQMPMQQQVQMPVQQNASPAATEQKAIAAAKVKSGMIYAVLLLTDGHANVGLTTADTIIPELSRHVGGNGVAVHTFGFGNDHNADLLRAISETTQGSYYYIETAEQIKEAFANCLGGLLSVVMQRINITLRSCMVGVRLVRALTKYPSQAQPDGSIQVRMADLYSGEGRDTLAEVEICGGVEQMGPTAIIQWVVQYDDSVLRQVGKEIRGNTTVTFSDNPASAGVDPQVDEQRRRLEVVQALDEARRAATAGNLQQARVVLQRTKESLAAAPSAQTPLVQGLFGECAQLEGVLQDRHEWESKGSKMTNMAMQRHAQQRSNAVSANDEHAMYATPFQMDMRKKAAKK